MTERRGILWIAAFAAALTLFSVRPAAAQFVYATDFEQKAMWKIDESTKAIVPPTIALSKYPGPIVVTPDGKTAYIANVCKTSTDTGSVMVVDLTQSPPTELPAISLSGCPGPIAISPDGTLVYVDVADSVTVIDTATNPPIPTSITNIFSDTTDYITALAVSVDGMNLYAAPGKGTSTAVISTATNGKGASIAGRFNAVDANNNFWLDSLTGVTVAGTSISMQCGGGAIGFTPDGKQAYVADPIPDCNSMIYPIDLMQSALSLGTGFNFSFVDPRFPTLTFYRGPASQIVFTPDSEVGYIAAHGGGVLTVDTINKAAGATIPPTQDASGNSISDIRGIAVGPNTLVSASQVTNSLDNGAVSVTFPGGVTGAGKTMARYMGASCPAAPGDFNFGTSAVCYDITTTAQFAPPAQVCVTDPSVTSSSALLHYVNGWTNVTTSVTNQTICGNVSSFSPFAIAQPVNSGATATSISLSPAASITYGTAATATVTVALTGGSGTVTGNVSLSVDGGAAIPMGLSSGSATFNLGVLGAGGHALSASFAAQGSFPASSANGTLVVTPAPLTLTADNKSKVYGATMPNLTFSASGFVNGETTASLSTQPTPSTTATAASGVGSYSIAISGAADPNYSISYVQGTLTVTAAVATITANNVTKILDAPNPSPLAWTANGFVNGDNASVLTANPMCTTKATTTSAVGSYPITCSGASAANYTFSYVAGTLTILYATASGHVIQPPIYADGTSVFKQGRTIPAKFNVYDANGVPIGTPGVVVSFFLTGIMSGTTTTAVENVVDTNNPDTAFRWDGQEWIFNITTRNLTAGSTYVYTITLNDGSTILFQYGLR